LSDYLASGRPLCLAGQPVQAGLRRPPRWSSTWPRGTP